VVRRPDGGLRSVPPGRLTAGQYAPAARLVAALDYARHTSPAGCRSGRWWRMTQRIACPSWTPDGSTLAGASVWSRQLISDAHTDSAVLIADDDVSRFDFLLHRFAASLYRRTSHANRFAEFTGGNHDAGRALLGSTVQLRSQFVGKMIYRNHRPAVCSKGCRGATRRHLTSFLILEEHHFLEAGTRRQMPCCPIGSSAFYTRQKHEPEKH